MEIPSTLARWIWTTEQSSEVDAREAPTLCDALGNLSKLCLIMLYEGVDVLRGLISDRSHRLQLVRQSQKARGVSDLEIPRHCNVE